MLAAVPVADIAASDAPLRLVVDRSGWSDLAPVTRAGACVAALGVLLNLVPGVSRTVLAMSRRQELPAGLAVIDHRHSSPVRAELLVAAVVIGLVALVDLSAVLGFSSVTVLTYYSITNAAALTLDGAERRFPRMLAVAGLVGCAALALALPASTVISGALVLGCRCRHPRRHDDPERSRNVTQVRP